MGIPPTFIVTERLLCEQYVIGKDEGSMQGSFYHFFFLYKTFALIIIMQGYTNSWLRVRVSYTPKQGIFHLMQARLLFMMNSLLCYHKLIVFRLVHIFL